MGKVLTVTFNPTVDAACETDVVRPTHKVRTREESFHPGGGGINVARIVERLGGSVTALYARGGVMGAVLDQLLEKRGIKSKIVAVEGNTRINNVIHEVSTGMEYRFIAEGPILTEKEWRKCLAETEKLDWDWLVVSGSLPRGVPLTVYDDYTEMAKKRGASIVLDTSGKGLQHIIEHGGATLVKPSQGEFEACMQRSFHSVPEMAATAQQLIHKGAAEIIAITLGHQGAVLITANKTLYLPSPAVKVFSASGAGDSFIGGMVHALSKGIDVEDSFRLGIACGSAAVMEKGTGLCQVENIRRLYQDLEPKKAVLDILPE
ncbi:MAG: Phosphofructokinase [Candidatus Tokpelaia hoelldobleri]|uniref:Phosphofructokinase n=1 Tax=Candidatus Tokpelaia hoelldobleri TaxID=1902579 RepID=A0A1U9JUG3_9HYPH|nr:MAG: Phosphofructokinase [Candidatus Tokpelaia hoelldoblerii]